MPEGVKVKPIEYFKGMPIPERVRILQAGIAALDQRKLLDSTIKVVQAKDKTEFALRTLDPSVSKINRIKVNPNTGLTKMAETALSDNKIKYNEYFTYELNGETFVGYKYRIENKAYVSIIGKTQAANPYSEAVTDTKKSVQDATPQTALATNTITSS